MEKPVLIQISHSTILVDKDMTWTTLKGLQDEAVQLVQGVTPVVNEPSTPEKATSDRTPPPSSVGASSSATLTNSPPGITLSRPIRRKLDKMFRQAASKTGLKRKHLKNPWMLYLSDIGGQLEFQELIPALTTGHSLHIIVIRASRGLNDKCFIEFLDSNGYMAHGYYANYTAKEELLLSLATIMSTGRDGKLPKAMVVLTFKDEVKHEQLIDLDRQLQAAVKTTEAYKAGVIVFAEEGRLSHFINNLDPEEDDIMGIRRTVQRIGKEFEIEIPYGWQIFGIALREIDKKVLQYDRCVEMARECGMEEKEEVDATLKFLHNIGTIRHYTKVPELQDVVVVDPQLLFDEVTQLVLHTFTFDSVPHPTFDDFKKKGIFPSKMINTLSTKSELFTSSKFIAFLKYHHIIAPLKEDGVVVKYFLPFCLVHANVSDTVIEGVHPPLVITFKAGYTPRGVFGFCVTELLEHKAHDDEFALELDEESIYRNQITLSVGPFLDKFTFSVCSTYIRVDVTPSPVDRTIPLSTICSFVCGRLCRGLNEIVTKLNYNCNAHHSLAFLCPCSDDKDLHPATITLYKGKAQALKCVLTKKVKGLPKGHEIWLEKEKVSTAGQELSQHFSPDVLSSVDNTTRLDLNHAIGGSWQDDRSTETKKDYPTSECNNTGYNVLVQCGEKIVGEFIKDSKTLAIQLHSKKFISDRTLAETVELEEIKHDKATRLHVNVLGIVRNHPQRYDEFVSILEGNGTLYSDLLRDLKKTYYKLGTP